MLQAALDFVDANGLAALSMPRLGAELGVQGMSLYGHVQTKDALLDGLVEAMSAELELPSAAETNWQEALRSLARSTRDLIRRHPAAAQLLVTRPVMPTRWVEQVYAYWQILISAGFTEDQAMDALRTVVVYTQGYAMVEVRFSAGAECGSRPDDELSRMRRVTEMVPRDAPGHLFRLAMLFSSRCDMDDQFNLGIDLMIRGLDCPSGETGS